MSLREFVVIAMYLSSMILMLQVFYDKYSNSNLAKHMKTGIQNYFAPFNALKGFDRHFFVLFETTD